jgi:hypothetical protein
VGHEESIIRRVVHFLQGWESTGVIFTRQPMPGAFSLDQVHLDSDAAPDVLVSMRWTPDKNKNGTPGMLIGEGSAFGPGQGLHVSLSPFDMHATLIAAGPHFRSGMVNTVASGNVDIAPTVLWILGITPPQPMDGRVLAEALTMKGPNIKAIKASEPGRLEARHEQDGAEWHQYLNITTVQGVLYIEEGNGKVDALKR